jgi:4-hydroxybenzoate polyprenyltransferase
MSVSLDTHAEGSLGRRLWIYQAERFPLLRTATLLAAFSAASINVSAFLAHRTLPGPLTYFVGFTVLLIVFFQLRAADEIKDADDDRRFRPERAIPRGLLSLRTVVGIAVGLIPVALAATCLLSAWLLIPLALVWFWLGLMTIEFGVPDWLKARPFLYLVSHMLIMPLIDLFVTATEWLVRAGVAPAGLWLFLTLSFVNGCVLEIGRKIYAPQNERTGVETYSALLDRNRAVHLWFACIALSFCLLAGVGFAVGAPLPVAAVGAIALASAVMVGLRFLQRPEDASQRTIDTMAGLWVFVSYVAAGFIPLLVHGG